MNNLFARKQYNVLKEIFLYLDPKSLKNCKLVNSSWCCFIDENLWGSKTGRKELERRLKSQWTDEEINPAKQTFDIGPVNSSASDGEIAVLGCRGKAVVLRISSGEILSEMNHKRCVFSSSEMSSV